MSQEKIMHRSVPIAGKLVPGYRVPPVGVKPSIREEGDFGEEVEDTFPNHVPCLVSLVRYLGEGERGAYHHVFHHKGEY